MWSFIFESAETNPTHVIKILGVDCVFDLLTLTFRFDTRLTLFVIIR